MGVNLWGESPLYVNSVNVLNALAKVLAKSKGGIVRNRLKEAGVQSYEPTNRNSETFEKCSILLKFKEGDQILNQV